MKEFGGEIMKERLTLVEAVVLLFGGNKLKEIIAGALNGKETSYDHLTSREKRKVDTAIEELFDMCGLDHKTLVKQIANERYNKFHDEINNMK